MVIPAGSYGKLPAGKIELYINYKYPYRSEGHLPSRPDFRY
mgnify:CR=1 FL=1